MHRIQVAKCPEINAGDLFAQRRALGVREPIPIMQEVLLTVGGEALGEFSGR
ncbi:hypothetical protein R5W24_003677 [Gemmata sp. JC717]|uniref:Uncharacterized protein n=1 Tax=Gemmata algarum TaxID=2975278 RepID=A0ABU5F7K6_9BACT|nr:hypothetical protein [Gemmata algarum]MDY3554553.1 hypothetical protein [Gemmata algarum]MDY3562727.1 hypothetical protein [Gemmata algarum]